MLISFIHSGSLISTRHHACDMRDEVSRDGDRFPTINIYAVEECAGGRKERKIKKGIARCRLHRFELSQLESSLIGKENFHVQYVTSKERIM